MVISKKGKVLISAGLLACALGITVGSTFALFTSEKTINNHIKVGDFKVGFYLTELKYDQISGAAIVEHTEDLSTWTGYVEGQGVDLSVYAGEVINVEKFAPSMGGYAMFKVVNECDIPFTYTLSVLNKVAINKDGDDVSTDFDEVMDIAITGTSSDPLAKDAAVTTNKLAFNFDADAGNDWQEATFSFDIQLAATQVSKN